MKSSALLTTQHTVGMGQGKPHTGSGYRGNCRQIASLEVGVNEQNELLPYGKPHRYPLLLPFELIQRPRCPSE